MVFDLLQENIVIDLTRIFCNSVYLQLFLPDKHAGVLTRATFLRLSET